MGSAAQNYLRLKEKVAEIAIKSGRTAAEVDLLAVSKRFPPEAVKEVYDAGCRVFGESRPQELRDKAPLLPADIRWHFIGPLQKNKIKYVAGRCVLIHAVDSLELARALSLYAGKHGLRLNVLAEVNMSGEEAKHGFIPEESEERVLELSGLPGLSLMGLMTIAPHTDDRKRIAAAFGGLHGLFEKINNSLAKKMDVLSMGMSADFDIAIREGSTIVRIGSAIFGARRK